MEILQQNFEQEEKNVEDNESLVEKQFSNESFASKISKNARKLVLPIGMAVSSALGMTTSGNAEEKKVNEPVSQESVSSSIEFNDTPTFRFLLSHDVKQRALQIKQQKKENTTNKIETFKTTTNWETQKNGIREEIITDNHTFTVIFKFDKNNNIIKYDLKNSNTVDSYLRFLKDDFAEIILKKIYDKKLEKKWKKFFKTSVDFNDQTEPDISIYQNLIEDSQSYAKYINSLNNIQTKLIELGKKNDPEYNFIKKEIASVANKKIEYGDINLNLSDIYNIENQ